MHDETPDFNPQPDPPAAVGETEERAPTDPDFNPQPDPPAEVGDDPDFNPQPDPPA